MVEHRKQAINVASKAVEKANARALQTLAGLDDPAQHAAITEEVKQEVAESPGWLDEVVELMAGRNEDVA